LVIEIHQLTNRELNDPTAVRRKLGRLSRGRAVRVSAAVAGRFVRLASIVGAEISFMPRPLRTARRFATRKAGWPQRVVIAGNDVIDFVRVAIRVDNAMTGILSLRASSTASVPFSCRR